MNLPDPGEPVGGVAPVGEVESGEPEERPPAAAPDEVRGALLDHVVLPVAAHVERATERERDAAYEKNRKCSGESIVYLAESEVMNGTTGSNVKIPLRPLPSCIGWSGSRIRVNMSSCPITTTKLPNMTIK